MGVYVQNNVSAMFAQRSLSTATDNLNKTFEKLSTGLKINRAGDDAAGLSISEKLRGQISGQEKAIENIQNGINVLQIAESAMSTISDHLQRIRELSVQAANGLYSTGEKQAVIDEVNERISDIRRISQTTKFNQLNLIDGTLTSLKLQVGANNVGSDQLDISPAFNNLTVTTSQLNVALGSSVTGANWSQSDIRTYIDTVDTAINSVVAARAKVGSYQNRLEATYDNVSIMKENLIASESRIRDADMAVETAALTKFQVLQQAAVSVLQQANYSSSIALSLLQGS